MPSMPFSHIFKSITSGKELYLNDFTGFSHYFQNGKTNEESLFMVGYLNTLLMISYIDEVTKMSQRMFPKDLSELLYLSAVREGLMHELGSTYQPAQEETMVFFNSKGDFIPNI